MTGTPQDDVLADLIARCPEHGYSTESWPECRCAAARKAAARLTAKPEPGETVTAPVALPPPSPALVLHQAAAELRALVAKVRAQVASNDYWGMGWTRGVENAIGGPEGVLAGLLTPDLADEMADWLDRTAVAAVRHAQAGGTQEEITDGYPIRTAQRILGEA